MVERHAERSRARTVVATRPATRPASRWATRWATTVCAIDSYANAINSDGVVAGTYRTPDSTTYAIRWSNGVVQLLPGAGSSSGSAIDEAGTVAGYTGRQRTPSVSEEALPTDSLVLWRDTIRIGVEGGGGYLTPRYLAANGDMLEPPYYPHRSASVSIYGWEFAHGVNALTGQKAGLILDPR